MALPAHYCLSAGKAKFRLEGGGPGVPANPVSVLDLLRGMARDQTRKFPMKKRTEVFLKLN